MRMRQEQLAYRKSVMKMVTNLILVSKGIVLAAKFMKFLRKMVVMVLCIVVKGKVVKMISISIKRMGYASLAQMELIRTPQTVSIAQLRIHVQIITIEILMAHAQIVGSITM